MVAEHSLLFSVPGSDPALKPAMILCHLDVSPIEEGSESAWTHPPFSGHVDDTFVWGARRHRPPAPFHPPYARAPRHASLAARRTGVADSRGTPPCPEPGQT